MEKIIKKIKGGQVFLNTGIYGVNAIINIGGVNKVKIYNTLEADVFIQTNLIKKVLDVLEDKNDIEIIKDKQLLFKQGKTELKVKFEDDKQYIEEIKAEHQITIEAADIEKIINLKKDIKTDADAVKYVYISDAGIAATDSYRLSVYNSNISNIDADYMIPYEVIDFLELAKNKIKVLKKGHDYILELGRGIKITWKNFYTQYPDIRNVAKFGDNMEFNATLNRKELEKVLKKAIKISVDNKENKNSTVWTIKRDSNKLEVYATNKEIDIEQELTIRAASDLKISLNGPYILDYLKRVKKDDVTFKFLGSNSMIAFDNDDYKYYCMPLAWRDEYDK